MLKQDERMRAGLPSAVPSGLRLFPGHSAIWWYLLGVGVLAFALTPASLERKAHIVLGGLCAQRPSHSFTLGGSYLPFDARMSGIYLGSLVAMMMLVALGRVRHAGRLSIRSWGMIAAFLGAMGVDGVNSLLVDLGRWHLYVPDNRLRLATGLLMGVGLGILLIFLLASSLWTVELRRSAPVVREAEIMIIVVVVMFVGLMVPYGGDWLFAPLTLFLLGGAIATVSALALACLAIIQAPFGLVTRWSELPAHMSKAAVFGIFAMLSMAALRMLAEWRLGPLDHL